MAENFMDSVKETASGAAGKGKDWLKGQYEQIEGWARENSTEGKQKLMAMAREHGIDVNDNMDAGQIKNMIKNKLRGKFDRK